MVYIHWLKTQPWTRTKEGYRMRLGKRATATCVVPLLSTFEEGEIGEWFSSKGIVSEEWSFNPYRHVYACENGMVYCAGVEFNLSENAYKSLIKE